MKRKKNEVIVSTILDKNGEKIGKIEQDLQILQRFEVEVFSKRSVFEIGFMFGIGMTVGVTFLFALGKVIVSLIG